MNAVVLFILICIFIYAGITWLLPKLIGCYLIQKFKIKVRFGRISFPFSLNDVNICKNGVSVQIEEMCIRSSFFNSEVSKLLSINIRDIRINKDIHCKPTVGHDPSAEPNSINAQITSKKSPLDFRNKKIPPSIITFAQFMAVHINNISIVLLNSDFDPGWLIHATIRELHLDGSIVHNAKSLIVTAAVNDAQAKILRHYPTKLQRNDSQNRVRPCLAEFSFGLSLDGVLIAQGPLSLEKLQLSTNNFKTTLHGGLYDFIRDANKGTQNCTNQISESTTEDCTVEDESDTTDAYQRISPIIPKNFAVQIENTSIQAVQGNGTSDFTACIGFVMVNGKFNTKNIAENYALPTLFTNMQIKMLDIDTKQEKLLFIEQFSIDSKLEKDTVNVYAKLKTFQLVYNHSEIYNWVKNNFTPNKLTLDNSFLSLPSNTKALHTKLQRRKSALELLMRKIVVKGCAELWNVSFLLKLDSHSASASFSHTKLLLEQYDEIRSSVYQTRWTNLLVQNRHWSTELMVESFWWLLKNSSRIEANNIKKHHARGSPFYVGVSLVKLSSYGDTTKLELSVHNLRAEYSNSLAKFVTKCVTSADEYRKLRTAQKMKKHAVAEIPTTSAENILVNVKVTDITCFLFNRHNTCLILTTAEISLSSSRDACITRFDRFQSAVLNTVAPNATISLTELSNVFANIKLIRIEYMKAEKQTQIYLQDDAKITWNANMHMHLVQLVRDCQEFWELIRPIPNTNLPTATPTVSKKHLVDFYANGHSSVGIKLSDRHTMHFFFENVNFSRLETRTVISIENAFINVDDDHIFSFNGVQSQSLAEFSVLCIERQNYEKFAMSSNRVWATTIDAMKCIFPYEHQFYNAVQQEFVSLFKWLKQLHNIKKKAFTADSPLPSDMFIQIKEFLFEMSDDPFEVKLRDNYVLLLDEYYESLKRKKTLDQKIAERCSDRLLLPTGVMEVCNTNLVHKNSEIYVQRSKQINEAGPTRTRLFAWIMTDLEIMAMADPTIHGTENVTTMMREIDTESPWPEEELEFTTLWCRAVNISCSEWKYMLRDFPQPMFCVKSMRLFGYLCGAEQAAPRRAKREVTIDLGSPFGVFTIQRGMTALKFYHDFDCELDSCSYAFGPCWEPVMAQCNLSFEKISPPSRDPSPTLPFWDKMRLLYHGRLTMIVKEFTVLLHASLDPYNTTEEMELTWKNCGIVWTNAKIMFKGELNVTVRTASRYDDCRLLHFPNLKLTFKLNWICLANPNDHHAVIPCAPDKLPEYSSNQVHDSFRAFRSQNVNIWVSFETKPVGQQQPEFDLPNLVLYGSTLRWFESLNLILSGVTRPTRRGRVFNNIRPRKKQLSRHYRKAHLQMSLHKFQVLYWMSHALHRGFQLNGGRVSFSSEHTQSLQSMDDGLIHRPRALWSTMYMNCELNDTEIWLKSILNECNEASAESLATTDNLKIVKFYFLSVEKVSYGREAMLTGANSDGKQKDTPAHKLVVYDLKGAWTKNNRDVAFALFDSFMKSQKLKNNLSTEALKSFRKDQPTSATTPLKSRRSIDTALQPVAQTSTATQLLSTGGTTSTSSSLNKHQQTGHAIVMLQQLIAEADHKFNVYSDDLSTQTREQQLQGLQACQDDDVTHYNWFISLVNSQVLLKGCETSGYVILSAAKAEILQRVHRPVWRDRSLVSKTTWVGSLECMQYYATVSAGNSDPLLDENIMWLTVDNIQEKDKDAVKQINEFPDLPHLVGSGQSVGGVVSETVGAGVPVGVGELQPIQLQRIVSRCKCEFFYVSYGDTSIDPSTLVEVPTPPSEETLSPWERQDDPVDAFTLMHHDLDVCTNSLQYAMILDVVNNLLLFVEPQRKQALEKLARMRFQLQLYSGEDQKRPIQHLQTQIRSLVSRLRLLEKDIYLIGKSRAEEGDSDDLRAEYEEVHNQIRDLKEILNTQSEELDMMLSCYKETQLSAMNKLATVRKDKPVTIVRANEICFKHAQWRLTEADGQIGIADLILSNFLYTKKSKSDDSVEHLLELGYIRMCNLIPREIYKEVLCPTEIQKDMPIDHKRVLRVFCREKPPVGGISVKEHFEINVVPVTIAITKKFYSTMLKFCFPDRDADPDGDDIDETVAGSSSSLKTSKKASGKSSKKSSKDSEFYVKIEKDDVEKMKERAEKNKLFIFIKIPEVPVRVSYKGYKDKNFEDITDFSLVIPTLEYHNVTWTWLDFLLAMKTDSRRVIVSQAIKQKLQIHRSKPLALAGERPSPQEEDKAKMLFGNRHANENKSQRRGVFKFSSKQ